MYHSNTCFTNNEEKTQLTEKASLNPHPHQPQGIIGIWGWEGDVEL